MDNKSAKKYSLQITISALFVSISLILGIILSWQSFNKTSDIMLSAADGLHERIAHELVLDFKASYGPIVGGLRQFRLSPVIKAKTFKQRIRYLSHFQAVLEAESSAFAVGIAYANGDYLGVSSVKIDYVRDKYSIPQGASFIVSYIKHSDSEPRSEERRVGKEC